jgi:ribosome-associated protein
MAKPLPFIKESEIKISAIRSQGPGGQHVNKTSSAIHLRFDVLSSSLPAGAKKRLLANPLASTTQEGVLVMKTQSSRSQEMNRLEAYSKLHALIEQALIEPKIRVKTKPTRGSKERRLESKKKEGLKKASRASVRQLA